MALTLVSPGATVKEFELHVFELAYILSLMSVESVAGLPTAVLFPKDLALRKKVLDQGEKRLLANGWLTPTDGQGGNYNEALLSMAAAIADPRLSILTRRESQGERADATIYFNKVEVVEVTQTDRQAFCLRRLLDPAEAFQRVRKMLGVTPRPRHSNLVIELRIDSFERVRRHAAKRESFEAIAELLEVGFSTEAAEDLAQAMSMPERKGIVSILKHVAQKVTDVRVMGFYLCEGGAWITSVANESANRVRVESVDTEGFIKRLVDRVASVNVLPTT